MNPRCLIFSRLLILLTCLNLSCQKATQNAQSQSVDLSDPVVKQIQKQYGVLPYLGSPYYNYDWDDYGACLPKETKQQLLTLEQQLQVNRYELFVVAVGEGLGFRLDNAPSESEFLNAEVSGFGELGTDMFGSELNELRKYGLLPKDFLEVTTQELVALQEANQGNLQSGQLWKKLSKGDFYIYDQKRNEAADGGKETTVKTAQFRNLRAGLIGFAGLYANRQRKFLNLAAKLGFKNVTADQKIYWNYYYYQSPSLAEQALRSRGIAVRFLGKEPDSSRPKSIPMKSLKRVATMRHMMAKNSLDLSTKCTVPLFQNTQSGTQQAFEKEEPTDGQDTACANVTPKKPNSTWGDIHACTELPLPTPNSKK